MASVVPAMQIGTPALVQFELLVLFVYRCIPPHSVLNVVVDDEIQLFIGKT